MVFPIENQEDLDKIISARLNKEAAKRSSLEEDNARLVEELAEWKKKFSEVDEQLNSDGVKHQGEVDGLTERISSLEKQLEEESGKLSAKNLEIMRIRAASEHGIPVDLIQGTTEKEIGESVEKLSAFIDSRVDSVQRQVGVDSPNTRSRDADSVLQNP